MLSIVDVDNHAINIIVHVPFNKTSINVTGLNPQLTCTLTMRLAVKMKMVK